MELAVLSGADIRAVLVDKLMDLPVAAVSLMVGRSSERTDRPFRLLFVLNERF